MMSAWAWPHVEGPDSLRSQPSFANPSKKATLVGISAIIGVIAGAISFAFTAVIGLSFVVALASAGIPRLFLQRHITKERLAMRGLWPDVVDSLVSALRAGAALPTAITSLAAFSSRTVTAAVNEFERQYRLTGNFDACLNTVKATWADPAGDRVVETLRLARHVGGSDVTKILRTLGSSLREESAIRQEVEARQGWIRTAARIGVAAPWIVLALLSTRPEAAAAYNSALGLTIILFGLGLSVVAYRIMLAVGVLPQPPRWFA
jgi:tight adherence protein B